MEVTHLSTLINILGGIFLIGLGWGISTYLSKLKVKNATSQVQDILTEARKEAARTKNKVILRAKEEWFNVRDEQEKRLIARQKKLDQSERELLEREKKLNRKENEISQKESHVLLKERNFEEQKDALKTKELELNRMVQKQNLALSRVSQMSLDEAKALLLENLRREYKSEASQIYKELVDRAKENAAKEARKIITMAIEKNAADHCVETTVSVVSLP
ncbi:MAG: Rnase Y domain-containing protein, partial [bacterium]